MARFYETAPGTRRKVRNSCSRTSGIKPHLAVLVRQAWKASRSTSGGWPDEHDPAVARLRSTVRRGFGSTARMIEPVVDAILENYEEPPQIIGDRRVPASARGIKRPSRAASMARRHTRGVALLPEQAATDGALYIPVNHVRQLGGISGAICGLLLRTGPRAAGG